MDGSHAKRNRRHLFESSSEFTSACTTQVSSRSLAVGRVDRYTLAGLAPLESTGFSRNTQRTFCSSRRQPRARLTDCELKFQNISDCLRRLIAPLLVRTASARGRAATTKARRSFIFRIDETILGAFSSGPRHTYIGAFAAHRVSINLPRVFYRRRTVTQHGSRPTRYNTLEEHKDPWGPGYPVIRIGDNRLTGRR